MLSVALRKESVDRNRSSIKRAIARIKSLSARRAWIEILLYPQYRHFPQVALRKESVDRNYIIKITEIWGAVALRKESVDRNS